MAVQHHMYIQCTFLSIKCIPNFIAIAIPEKTRRHSRRQGIYKLLKLRAFQASIGLKNAIFFRLCPDPSLLHRCPALPHPRSPPPSPPPPDT